MSTSAERQNSPDEAPTEPDGRRSDPPGNGENGDGWSAHALSADEAERLSTRFRASWESIEDAGGWSAAPSPAPAPVHSAAALAATQPQPQQPAPPAGAPASSSPGLAAATAKPAVMPAAQGPLASVASPAYNPAALPPREPSGSSPIYDDVVLPRSSNRLIYIGVGLGVIVLLAMVGTIVSGMGDDEDRAALADTSSATPAATTTQTAEPAEAAPTPEPAAAAAAEPVAEPEPAPVAEPVAAAEPTPAPEPARVRVAIRATPATAILSIDGARVSNPYETQVEPDPEARHTVLATATGYASSRRVLAYDAPVDLTLELAQNEPPPRPARTARTARQRRVAAAMRASAMRASAMASTTTATMRRGFVTTNPY